ncbi:hypothetical protein YC2023_072147 [Brassica napus]
MCTDMVHQLSKISTRTVHGKDDHTDMCGQRADICTDRQSTDSLWLSKISQGKDQHADMCTDGQPRTFCVCRRTAIDVLVFTGSGTFRRNMVILESFGSFGGAELHRRVRYLAMDGDLSTVRLGPYFDTRCRFELAFQCHRSQVNQHPVAEGMPFLQKSGQSASREEAAEKRKPRRSMQHSARRSMEIPDRGPCIFYCCVKPRSHKLPKCPWTTRNPIYVISKPLLTARLLYAFIFIVFS